ncbi:hypothetical protein CDD83_4223 [Cordyceps sp. RAO-2017]|nr:hypothetical protein CDD83_4223 [Cordyceps sp. RAO-2017]
MQKLQLERKASRDSRRRREGSLTRTGSSREGKDEVSGLDRENEEATLGSSSQPAAGTRRHVEVYRSERRQLRGNTHRYPQRPAACQTVAWIEIRSSFSISGCSLGRATALSRVAVSWAPSEEEVVQSIGWPSSWFSDFLCLCPPRLFAWLGSGNLTQILPISHLFFKPSSAQPWTNSPSTVPSFFQSAAHLRSDQQAESIFPRFSTAMDEVTAA